jgi:hypothetical protein
LILSPIKKLNILESEINEEKNFPIFFSHKKSIIENSKRNNTHSNEEYAYDNNNFYCLVNSEKNKRINCEILSENKNGRNRINSLENDIDYSINKTSSRNDYLGGVYLPNINPNINTNNTNSSYESGLISKNIENNRERFNSISKKKF